MLVVTDKLNDIVAPKVTPWFHSLRNMASPSDSGPGTRVPNTLPLVVELPSVLSLAKPLIVAVFPSTLLPPTKSKTTKPVWPLMGVVLTVTL